MRLAYWQRGEHCMHTHELTDEWATCGVVIATDAMRHLFDGELAAIDCRRCLRMLRKRARDRLAAVDKRLAGKCGIQRDAFE